MNKRIKTKWLKALRSGKYKQGIGRLQDRGKYCCLGVLCDLAVKEGVKPSRVRGEDVFYGKDSIEFPPPTVVKWAGLKEKDPSVSDTKYISLSHMNDNRVPFNKIADVIEEQL